MFSPFILPISINILILLSFCRPTKQKTMTTSTQSEINSEATESNNPLPSHAVHVSVKTLQKDLNQSAQNRKDLKAILQISPFKPQENESIPTDLAQQYQYLVQTWNEKIITKAQTDYQTCLQSKEALECLTESYNQIQAIADQINPQLLP